MYESSCTEPDFEINLGATEKSSSAAYLGPLQMGSRNMDDFGVIFSILLSVHTT